MLWTGIDRWWDAKDELMVVNLKSITSPRLVNELSLGTPYGLTIRDTLLYVAQGHGGWTLFGLSNPSIPAVLANWQSPAVRDFIWTGHRLYMMCFDKIMIYSAADPRNPVPVAEIE
jgi:hypothetical protein